MKLIFEKDGENRLIGYSEQEDSVTPEKETVLVSESDLNQEVPDSVEGGWKENKRKFKLDDSGNIVFDESYEPKDHGGK